MTYPDIIKNYDIQPAQNSLTKPEFFPPGLYEDDVDGRMVIPDFIGHDEAREVYVAKYKALDKIIVLFTKSNAKHTFPYET